MLACLSIFNFSVLIYKFFNQYSKTQEDFFNAPETFKFEERDWTLKLGWEKYN